MDANDGNCSDTHIETVVISSIPTPSFTAPATCQNTQTFTNTSTGATNYEWLVGGVISSTQTNFNYTFPNQGTYTITLRAINGTCSEELSQNVTIGASSSDLNLPVDTIFCGASAVTR